MMSLSPDFRTSKWRNPWTQMSWPGKISGCGMEDSSHPKTPAFCLWNDGSHCKQKLPKALTLRLYFRTPKAPSPEIQKSSPPENKCILLMKFIAGFNNKFSIIQMSKSTNLAKITKYRKSLNLKNPKFRSPQLLDTKCWVLESTVGYPAEKNLENSTSENTFIMPVKSIAQEIHKIVNFVVMFDNILEDQNTICTKTRPRIGNWILSQQKHCFSPSWAM